MLPTVLRSWRSSVCATAQPSLFLADQVLDRKHDVVEELLAVSLDQDRPSAVRIRWMVIPGVSLSGTAIIDRPRCLGTSQLLRQRQSPQSASWAPLLHILAPLRT